ncbi:Borealin N terminal-domain-containing protein [Pseudoneurospora amorphoporcata]|uniref:Borealin N terminal-domain-containing protein n=1 Tax=Pseudoneurospora amorphoporcata TaxID=241081 RepID=A0AAN6NZ62_9PEZI|nr:Borealin N terminal-domain-containing protein [Pseudoneurospora amorphoporcata]
MSPTTGAKRKSDEADVPDDEHNTGVAAPSLDRSTTENGRPDGSESPAKKKRRTGITAAQKQALIDNLQLELTERARKLRANYNIHAQSLRTRIEIRVNRIPMSLRKVKMGDLIEKYSEQQQKTATTSRGPPVPPKDATTSRPILQRPTTASTTRPTSPIRPSPIKTTSHEVSSRNKENYEIEPTNTEKRQRLGPAADMLRNYPNQVLSPTSSNSRLAPRGERTPSPTKQHHARPISPTKPTAGTSASTLLSNMVEKARSRANSPQKHSTITEATQASAAKSRARAATTSTAYATTTRTLRRVSGASVSSEASSTSSMGARRQRPATATGTRPGTAASAKRGVISTIKKGVAATKKAAGGGAKEKAEKAAPAAAAAPATSGRVLRKRG